MHATGYGSYRKGRFPTQPHGDRHLARVILPPGHQVRAFVPEGHYDNSPRPPDPVELAWPQQFKNQAQVGLGVGRFSLGQLSTEVFKHRVMGMIG